MARPRGGGFRFEYLTSGVSLFNGDGIVVHVVNDSGANESTQVVIYQNTGAGATTAADSGLVQVVPSWMWGFAYTIPSSGEYWLRIRASSENLVPKASFERFQNAAWMPVISYRPGDFAIFKLQPTRQRLW
jgi:hypothetical protein